MNAVQVLQTLEDHILDKDVVLDTQRIQHALEVAEDAYKDSRHWSGETYMEHVTGILRVLLPFQPDEDAIIACILHHILSVDGWSFIELERQFGPKVRALVSGVHLLAHVTVHNRRNTIEDLRLMLLTVSDDIRIILISLCDRCYLLEHMEAFDEADKRRMSLDAVQLFAPVAARLGIYSMKHRLEDAAFPVLYPDDAERITKQIHQYNEQHGDFTDRVILQLTTVLEEQGIRNFSIAGREKKPYSIFIKMRQKSLSHIGDIYDYFAFRVIVPSLEECYQVLGFLHRVGRPLSHRFKDYISFPKPNGYQSLHTTLMQLPGAPEEVPIEIQVRTEDMDREANFGVAAHWSYKSHGSTVQAMEQVQLQKMLASQELLESEDEAPQLVDHIFVLSPKGDIIELPEGATPLDFAFQVHTDLGLSFRGARVNGNMVPIDHPLENGDIVEILKHKTPNPSPQWFNLLKVASAKSKLRRYLYAQERPTLITQGRQLVNELLRKHHLPPLDQDLSILRMCDGTTLSFSQREDVLMKIGQGAERASSLLVRSQALEELLSPDKKADEKEEIIALSSRSVALEGGVPMPTRCAKVCKPDECKPVAIAGVISRTGKVVIHKKSCKMLQNSNPERRIKAKWA